MGKGLLALQGVTSTAGDATSRSGKRTRETRVSSSDIRTSLADFEVLLDSLRQMAATSDSTEKQTILLAINEIEQSLTLSKGTSTTAWESAEYLLDRALRRLGPVVSVKGKDNPLARRFVTLVNRDSRRRGKHQISYLHHRGLLNNKAADVTGKNVDKIWRASVMRGDPTALSLSVLERAERTCERLGSENDIEKSLARQQIADYIKGLARVSGTYLDARMSGSSNLSTSQRARSESWLTTAALSQTQIAQALASGLAQRSANSVTNKLVSTGALAAHQNMLTKVVGPDAARQASQGVYFAVGRSALEQVALSTGDQTSFQKIKGLGIVISEDLGRDTVDCHEKGRLSGTMMHNLFNAALPAPKVDATRTHPAVVASAAGIRSGMLTCLANMASTSSGGDGYQPQSEEDQRWSLIVASACKRSNMSVGAALKTLATTPDSQRLKTLARLACGHDDSNTQKIVLQSTMKLAASSNIGSTFIKECMQGWQQVDQRVLQSRQLAS